MRIIFSIGYSFFVKKKARIVANRAIIRQNNKADMVKYIYKH